MKYRIISLIIGIVIKIDYGSYRGWQPLKATSQVQLTELQNIEYKIKEIKTMANYSLMTVKKGNITTVDGFIKTFNTIGHNMKALAVSAYGFLTSEDKELSIEFGKRVRDELKMSKATLSNLRTAGWLYTLNDYFEEFSYTNVILFKKNVEELEEVNEATLGMMLREIAQCSNSQLSDDVNECVEYLTKLSQKDLKHIIEVYNTPIAEATVEDVEEVVEEDVEEVVEDTVEEAVEEEEARQILVLEEDLNAWKYMLGCLRKEMTKDEIFKTIEAITVNMESYK